MKKLIHVEKVQGIKYTKLDRAQMNILIINKVGLHCCSTLSGDEKQALKWGLCCCGLDLIFVSLVSWQGWVASVLLGGSGIIFCPCEEEGNHR